jgi:hypothetical protein
MTAKTESTQNKATFPPLDDGEFYIDPVDEWLAEQSGEWSEKYQGKYLAIVDCEVVGVEDTMDVAFKVFDKYPNEIPFVWYVPMEEELEMLL